jgi:hypothetical protein
MSFKLQFTELRPSTAVQFYDFPQEILTYILDTYGIDTNPSKFWTMSPDGLTRSGIAEFVSEQNMNRFNSDAKLLNASIIKEQECNNNGIVRNINLIQVNQDPVVL